jgi:transposase-like protein
VELAALEMRPAATNVIEGRVGMTPACAHCGAQRVVRNGQADGLQRYKCRGCNKTFNALTGTALARLRQKGKWLTQAAVLHDGLSIHEAAERLDVAPSTALRWRHRFLAMPKTVQAKVRVGIAETDETYFLRSHKAQRGTGQPPRKRGGKAKNALCLLSSCPCLWRVIALALLPTSSSKRSTRSMSRQR